MMMIRDSSYGHTGTSSPLRDYFEHHLKVPDARGRLFVHILTDSYRLEDWHSENLGPRRGPREHLQLRHTILVFMGAPAAVVGGGRLCGISPNASPTRKRNEQVLVLGLTCWEYGWNEGCGEGWARAPSRTYIQYVDSTGMFRPRKAQGALTRAVISTYLLYCRDILKLGFIHLLASPKPSLLFPGSENLPRKRLLDGPHLINWWMSLIQATFMQSPKDKSLMSQFATSPPCMEAFVYSAVEEGLSTYPQAIRSNLQVLNRIALEAGTDIRWHWGWPYDANEGQDAIPFFEDDPKWRHYEAVMEDLNDRPAKRQRRDQAYVTVKEFFETIACRSEFRHDLSVFLVVKFPSNLSITWSLSQTTHLRAPVSDFSLFITKLLLTLKFATEADALKSSMCIWSWLKLRGVVPLEIEVSASEEIQDVNGCFHHIARHLEQLRGAAIQGASPNDVQALIRRKVPRSS